MELRVQQFSTEAQAYIEGEKRITVEIPGENDAEKVLKELGKPGSLYICTKEESTPSKKDIKAKKYIQLKNNSQDDGYLGCSQFGVII